jgi:hypothetical protein
LFFEVQTFCAFYPTEGFCLTCILAEDEHTDDHQLRIEVASDRGGIETGISRSGREVGRKDYGGNR